MRSLCLPRSRSKICLVILCFLVMSITGCGGVSDGKVYNRNSIKAIIDSAEFVLNDNPAQACRLLESIDANSIRGKELKAYFSLLYTEALYKNYSPIENDSLIMTAVRYYSSHKDKEKLFRSFYCLGCIYAELRCYTDAAVALLQAEGLVGYVNDEFRKGLLYMQMGAVFFDSFDFKRAEPYFRKSVDCYELAGKDYHRVCALGEIGRCRMQQEDYSGAIEYFDKVIGWEGIEEYPKNLSQMIINKVTCQILAGNVSIAISEINRTILPLGILENNSRSLAMIARCYIMDHDFEKARLYLNMGWDCFIVDSINLYYAESLFQDHLGNYEKALYYYRQSIYLQNSQLNLHLDNPVVGAQRDYYRTVSELELIRTRNKDIVITTSFIILSLIVISFYCFSRYKKQQTDSKIRDFLFTISQLTEKESLIQETISDLNQRIFELSAWESINKDKIKNLNIKVREMLRQQFSPSDYLYTRFYEQIDDNKKAERLYKVVKKQIDDFTSPINIARLDVLLNETFGGIMNDLSSTLSLNDKELLLLRFVLAGFSAKSIAALLNDSHQNITQRKKRLLDKIKKTTPEAMRKLDIALNFKQF